MPIVSKYSQVECVFDVLSFFPHIRFCGFFPTIISHVDADYDLLLGLAIGNNGQAVRAYDGFGDARDQLVSFYRKEMTNVLLSDVAITLAPEVSYNISQETSPKFAVLPDGSEIVMRGRLAPLNIELATQAPTAAPPYFACITTGQTPLGPQSWLVEAAIDPAWDGNVRCRQSFAHLLISELLDLRSAMSRVGVAVLRDELPGYLQVCDDVSMLACIRDVATALALEAQLVWPGLTALVTISDCFSKRQYGTDQCLDFDTTFNPDEASEADDAAGNDGYGDVGRAAAGGSGPGWRLMVCMAVPIHTMIWLLF